MLGERCTHLVAHLGASIKTDDVKAQSRKQFQSTEVPQVNVERERSKTKKRFMKKQRTREGGGKERDREGGGGRRKRKREGKVKKKRNNRLPKIQSESGENEPVSRPQFHAIESGRSKLKTNRFPASCWHALCLCGSSPSPSVKKTQEKRT